MPGNKVDTYRAVVPGGEGDAVEDGADGSDSVSSVGSAGSSDDAGNAGSVGDVEASDTASGASAPNSENHAIAAESMMALGREDYMTALAMANPSAAAPSVVA